MPLRIAFWTSGLEPSLEAVSSEVWLLRRSFPKSFAWGISHRRWCRLRPIQRSWCVHPNLHFLFRGLTRIVESYFDISHVFGSLADWFYLEGRKKRPVVLTMAVHGRPVDPSLLDCVDQFVVEWPSAGEILEGLGIDTSRIRLIFPPVDLMRFTPGEKPDGPFTVLFASSPERADWLESRGVLLLLETAALRPDVHFRLLWRPWGNSLPHVRAWVREHDLQNVEILSGRFRDMTSQYQAAHVTVAPFKEMEHCKPTPSSLIESLACGRPILTTTEVGLSRIVEEQRCGVVASPCPQSLAAAIDRLQVVFHEASHQARKTAERWFSEARFVARYQQVYDEVV